MRHLCLFAISLSLLLFLSACVQMSETQAQMCRIVLEEGDGFLADTYVQDIPRGSDLTFTLYPEDGFLLAGCDYSDFALLHQTDCIQLVLPNVRYTETVRLFTQKSDTVFSYYSNGGQCRNSENRSDPVNIPMTNTHLRLNTAGHELFTRSGYTQTGWNTQPDGTGTAVGLGSRHDPAQGQTLYAQWSTWTDADLFLWEPVGNGAAITGCLGTGDTLTIPAELGGLPVRIIRANSFANAQCETVILPETLETIEDGAFVGATLSTLYLFDSIHTVSDYAFQDCTSLQTLHINAVEAPCYSGTYYAAFSDKLDRLQALQDKQKIVLFSGSSTRFGYDSEAIDLAFPLYDVVNMGVFAYTNALPQLEIIRCFMNSGDILIHSPEFDAAQRQFCTSTNLDVPFFCMTESNYDTVALLDLRNYGQVFTPLHAFLTAREAMEPRNYELSPSDYDEDGHAIPTSSYNEYGDYILYRPNATEETPVYGLAVRYLKEAFPFREFIQPLNQVYQTFLDKGVRVFFTYAPRNRLALSADSTKEAISELDQYFRQTLCVPVLSSIEVSLVSGTYLSGTDNHLSSKGVILRTNAIIQELAHYLEGGSEYE